MILGPSTLTLTDAGNAAILTQATVAGATVGELHNATCDLIVGPITPTPATQFGDLTIPSWSAYAAQVVTWFAPAVLDVGVVEMDGAGVSFTLPAGAVGQTIYGWAISDTSPRLCVVALLAAPVLINVPQTCVLAPAFVWQAPPGGAPLV